MKLKLNTGKASSPDRNNASQSASTDAAAPAPPTPASAASGGGFKLSLKAKPTPEQAPTSAASANKGKQQGKARKPAAGGSKKRQANDDTISPAAKRVANGAAPTRKISLKVNPQAKAGDDAPQSAGGSGKLSLKRRSTAPKLRSLTAKRPPPPRLPGQGYDSEDSDAEEDPAIQQAFILRMQPGEDCDYVREAIANGKFGVPANEGPAEVSLRFVDKDFRRAVVTVRGRMYAAVLVDLPCIVETMKSWDKKGWWKVADLCQMLLVLGRCSSDDEAKNYTLPREVDKETLQYAHGLTPPMHWVRKRRFRKRLTYKAIANVDEEVERLLKEDEAAEKDGGEVSHEYLDRADLERSQEPGESNYDDEDDAEGEAIETVENGQDYEEYYSEDGDEDLEENLQAMFDADDQPASSAAPAVNELMTESPAPLADQGASFSAVENTMGSESAAATPAQEVITENEAEDTTDHDHSDGSDDDGSDDDDDDDDEEESPDVMDEDAAAKAAERNQQLEEVADLEREIDNQKKKVEAITNQLLKQRAVVELQKLEEDLRVKRGAFGLGADEDD